MKNVNTFDKDNIEWDRVNKVADDLRALRDEMNEIFPGRTGLITQMIYAMLIRHHPLLFGEFGTAKTDVVNSMFGQIKGANKSGFPLNKFSSPSEIFGMPNITTLTQTGQLEIDTQDPSTVFQSEFIELDEFLDANAPVQRSLLGILNERVWKRGRNFTTCKLHTAVATTNKDPEVECAADPQLGAVIDRFLFHCKVEYLKTPEERMRMYEKFLKGKVPTTEIQYKELEYISNIVLSANQIEERVIIETYEKIIEEYVSTQSKVVSDRRKCKLTQLIEAEALMNGRFEVHPEDILAVKWGLCFGNDTAAHEKFDEIANKHIAIAKEALAQDVDKLQMQFIDSMKADVTLLTQEPLDQTTYFDHLRRLNKIKDDMDTVKPQLDSTRIELKRLADSVTLYDAGLAKFALEVR